MTCIQKRIIHSNVYTFLCVYLFIFILPAIAHAKEAEDCHTFDTLFPNSQTELFSELGNDSCALVSTSNLPSHSNGHIRLKTNVVGWAMLVANAGVEFDLADRWSLSVPIYYSALNYFTSTLKFRTLCLQPEARYWLANDHKGWFVGVHLGAGYFNYAVGDYRVQDHNGKCPAYGGGLSAGWRFNLSSDSRWQMELTAGVGIYRARYDKFKNVHNGAYLVRDARHTFFGVDQAAVSISYSFGKANNKNQSD